MITQKQLTIWTEEAYREVEKHFPGEELPTFIIASERAIISRRDEIIDRTGIQTQKLPLEEYGSAMEYIGGMILIRQKYVPENELYYKQMVCHELGHFWAMAHEGDFSHYTNPGINEEHRKEQKGYWFWKEFIAEYISLQLVPVMCFPDDRLLHQAFTWYRFTVDEEGLGIYFAHLLVSGLRGEFTGAYKTGLEELQEILTKMVAREEFWKLSDELLAEIGCIMESLTVIKYTNGL